MINNLISNATPDDVSVCSTTKETDHCVIFTNSLNTQSVSCDSTARNAARINRVIKQLQLFWERSF